MNTAPAELRDPAWRDRVREALATAPGHSLLTDDTVDGMADWVWARLQAQAAADALPEPGTATVAQHRALVTGSTL